MDAARGRARRRVRARSTPLELMPPSDTAGGGAGGVVCDSDGITGDVTCATGGGACGVAGGVTVRRDARGSVPGH